MQHRGGAHPSTHIRRARGQVSKPRVESKIQFAFKSGIDFIDKFEGLFQLQTRTNRLHPQMIFFVDHDTEGLPPIYDHRAASALRCVFATD